MTRIYIATILAVVVFANEQALADSIIARPDWPWVSIVEDDFSGSTSNQWTFEGRQNGSGHDLIVYSGAEYVAAEWDQSNTFSGYPNDPYIIEPSRLIRPLDYKLTDRDTFLFGATLNIENGSIPDTTEFYQLANFGLYNSTNMGADRTMSDNWSGNSTLVKDGSDFIEFNYFLLDAAWGGPSVQPTIGTHIYGLSGNYVTGSSSDSNFFHETSMGTEHLPEGTNLYIEVIYFGEETNEWARRAYGAIYTDEARTNILRINGNPMYYWTQPVATTHTFSVDSAAFYNYTALNYGGVNAVGAGVFDDLYVCLHGVEISAMRLANRSIEFEWESRMGIEYAVLVKTNLMSAGWVTNALITGTGGVLTYSNSNDGASAYYTISY